MELLLWRWSTAVQVTSAGMLAVFFLVLTRSVSRAEARPFAWAWMANLAALTVTVGYWFLQPSNEVVVAGIRFGYLSFKTLFLVLLIAGAWAFVRPGTDMGRILRFVIPPVVLFGVGGALAVDTVDALGVVQATTMAVGLGVGMVLLVRWSPTGSGWLMTGFALRAALAVVEAAAYATRAAGLEVGFSPGVAEFLAAHSSLDTGAEWVIALGCVLMIYRAIQDALESSNEGLRSTQHVLQGLVDQDPLTGLANRRALPAIMRRVWEPGATLLFFDLDDFKGINDTYGHQVGDDVLTRFADALRHAFRPDDHLVRYGGDEFLVVAPAALERQVLPRLDAVRARLAGSQDPRIAFTVGHAPLPPRTDPAAALAAADAAMYAAKVPAATRGAPEAGDETKATSRR